MSPHHHHPPLFAGWVRRARTSLLLCGSLLAGTAWAQGMGMPADEAAEASAPTTAAAAPSPAADQTPPSLRQQANAASPAPASAGRSQGGQLPRESGQEYREYDLRPYTGYLPKQDHPEQAVVDWILRETGTDVWFGQPFGFLSADRDTLSVYHTPEMQAVVSDVVDRFVSGNTDPQVVNLRMMTVGNPNWRSRVHLAMQHVSVQSPGVQAWLLTKENAALIVAMLKQRSDAQEVQMVDVVTHNGQNEELSSIRGRNYVRNVRQAPTGWPPYEPETGEVQEGYRLELSPLLSPDGATLDCVIRAEIDQVDRLVPVDLDLPLPNGQTHRARIEVPQVVSWRLHERFRWPTDMVLLLSCGVVASPDRLPSAVPLLNLDALTGTTAGRADALLFVEFRGRASDNLIKTPQMARVPGADFTRGRY